MSTETKNETVKEIRTKSTNEIRAENYYHLYETLLPKYKTGSITDQEKEILYYYNEKWVLFYRELEVELLQRASPEKKREAVMKLIVLLIDAGYRELIPQYIGVRLDRLDYRDIFETNYSMENILAERGCGAYDHTQCEEIK